MADAPEIARLTPAGATLLDTAVHLGPLLAEGNVPATLRFAKEIEHALTPSLSLSQIEDLHGAVAFATQFLGHDKARELQRALTRLRTELTQEGGGG